jgi:hypothetical protein
MKHYSHFHNLFIATNVMAKGAKSASANKSDIMSLPVKAGDGPVQKYKPTPSFLLLRGGIQ